MLFCTWAGQVGRSHATTRGLLENLLHEAVDPLPVAGEVLSQHCPTWISGPPETRQICKVTKQWSRAEVREEMSSAGDLC